MIVSQYNILIISVLSNFFIMHYGLSKVLLKYMERKLIVITGGPGVGKTQLLNELSRKGYETVSEDARRIIREQMKINGEGLPWKNKALYSELMLQASVETYRRVINEGSSNIIFFDRGILDTICYMQMESIPISDELRITVNLHAYQVKVFILPPWEEIYETDSERKQTWEEAVYTFEKMKATYLEFGYEIVEVPKISVQKRAGFVVDVVNNFRDK